MAKFKIKFNKSKDKDKLYEFIDYELNIVKEKKKSLIVKSSDYWKVHDKMIDAIENYNYACGDSLFADGDFDYDIKER